MDKSVELKHGSGGEAMTVMLKDLLLPNLGDSQMSDEDISLHHLDDAGVVEGLALTTDTYTVRPVQFPGGNIGTIAFSGTVNDLSVMGARPIAISSGMLIPSGYQYETLKQIVSDMFSLSKTAGVPIVTGDTKVVEAGSIDDLYINTSGMGVPSPYLDHNHSVVSEYSKPRKTKWLSDSNISDGDVIICSGYLGDHGIALMSLREGYSFHSTVKSDAQPLNSMIEKALAVGGITACKDPTRGGLANLLNEWREKSGIGILVREEDIPVRESVSAACDIMGIDPLSIGNEGKAVFAVVPEMAEDVLKALRSTPEGRDASIIGRATTEEKYVVLETSIGGKRILEPPVGDPVPRIC